MPSGKKRKMKKSFPKIRLIALSGVIAALYCTCSLVFAPISYGMIQVRISEALCVLPLFTPAAIPGLFVGCLLSNLFSPAGFIWADLVFGSLATLLSAMATYWARRLPPKPALWLAPLPAVVLNAIAVPFIIKYGYGSDAGLLIIALTVLIGQCIACYGLGIPLTLALRRIGLDKRM